MKEDLRENLARVKEALAQAEYEESQREKNNAVSKWEKETTESRLVNIESSEDPDAAKNSRANVDHCDKKSLFENTRKMNELRKAFPDNKVSDILKGPVKGTTFESVLKEMQMLHTKKNTDYGNAWHEEIQEFGPICGVLRLYEKTKRLSSLYKNGKAEVGDESFEDTLIDIANYAVMTLAEIRLLNKEAELKQEENK